MSILCFFGSHRTTTVHQFPFLDSANIFRCEDCGGLIATDRPFHEGQRLCGNEVPREALKAMPQAWVEQLRAAKLVGLQPPEPWPAAIGRPADVGAGVASEPEAGPAPIEKAQMSAYETPQMLKELQGLRGRLHSHVRQNLKDQVWIHVAKTTALLGTCCRLKVGCVLAAKDGSIVGTGYNGAGPGMPHCEADHCNETCRCGRTLHAEQNALFKRKGVPYTAYTTHEPCLNCTKELIVAGVRRVVYDRPYTSIAEKERADRQEWIDFYGVEWSQIPSTEDLA